MRSIVVVVVLLTACKGHAIVAKDAPWPVAIAGKPRGAVPAAIPVPQPAEPTPPDAAARYDPCKPLWESSYDSTSQIRPPAGCALLSVPESAAAKVECHSEMTKIITRHYLYGQIVAIDCSSTNERL
jgi:hypothetical protein